MKIADQAILETDDYPGLSRLGDADSSGGLCDEASAALQHVFGLVASWSPALQDAWKSPEQNFEQALTACRAGDGAAMVRAYRQAESSLPHFRDVLANLDCHLDPDDSSSLICR